MCTGNCVTEHLKKTEGDIDQREYKKGLLKLELDRVGPVDNRPFTDKLHHFSKIIVSCDT